MKKINAAEYVVINDGQFLYPLKKSDVNDVTPAKLRKMDEDEYAEWCRNHPCIVEVGSQEIIDLCRELIDDGADEWYIGN